MNRTFCKVLTLALTLLLFHGLAYATPNCINGWAYLTVNKTGTGDGTVSANTSYCKDNLVTAHPTAVADGYSTFTVWGGDCGGTTSPASVYMDRDRTCIATFTCNYDPYRIGSTLVSFESVQAAYDAMPDGNTLDIRGLSFSGNLLLDHDKTVTLRGGYSCYFVTNAGYTTITSSLTITHGKATVEKLIIK